LRTQSAAAMRCASTVNGDQEARLIGGETAFLANGW
jgi:hypothetical protein